MDIKTVAGDTNGVDESGSLVVSNSTKYNS